VFRAVLRSMVIRGGSLVPGGVPQTYQHPKYLAPPKKLMVPSKNLRTALAMLYTKKRNAELDKKLKLAARNYFGQELMRGAKIEELKKDSYWHYMED
jgi:hypothetical protein